MEVSNKFKTPKSKRGAIKQYSIALMAYIKKWSGGGMYGYDYPTMRMNDPETYAYLMYLRSIYHNLPD